MNCLRKIAHLVDLLITLIYWRDKKEDDLYRSTQVSSFKRTLAALASELCDSSIARSNWIRIKYHINCSLQKNIMIITIITIIMLTSTMLFRVIYEELLAKARSKMDGTRLTRHLTEIPSSCLEAKSR